ncbi:MAG: hypothetical protein ABIA37_05005 [Candidatus Woesearchaeota archaeon]
MINHRLLKYLDLVSKVGEAEYDWRYNCTSDNKEDLVDAMRELHFHKQRFGQPNAKILEKNHLFYWENKINDGNYFGSDYLIGLIAEKGRLTRKNNHIPFKLIEVENDFFKGLDLYENYCGGIRTVVMVGKEINIIYDSIERRGIPLAAVFDQILEAYAQMMPFFNRRGSR